MGHRLLRVIYKRVLEGDVLKLKAQSHQAKTGGGARDVRFRPWDRFEAVINRMFPETEQRERQTDEGKTTITVRKAKLRWFDEGDEEPRELPVRFWPPTHARPNEGRLAEVSKIPPFAADRIPTEAGAVFYCLWQDGTGLWGAYLTEQGLGSGDWNAQLARSILDTLAEAERDGSGNARGFIDFETHDSEHFSG